MDFSRVTDFLNSLPAEGIVGGSCKIIHKDEEVYNYRFGYADLENKIPMEYNTICKMFSMTKLITCISALQLYEQGKYLMNDKLGDYLPEFKNMMVQKHLDNGVVELEPANREITIRDVFTMTAGFTYGGEGNLTLEGASKVINKGLKLSDGFTNNECSKQSETYKNLQKSIINESTTDKSAVCHESESENIEILEKSNCFETKKNQISNYDKSNYNTRDFVKDLAKVPLAYQPATHWCYSLGHDVLGAFIEVISGETLGEYFEEHIFKPLEMNDTFFRVPENKINRKSVIYSYDKEKNQHTKYLNDRFEPNACYESGGAGISSTIEDYIKFANTLTRGGTSTEGVRIIGRKTIDLMRTNHLNEVQRADYNWEHQAGYGYGLGVRTMVDVNANGCNGSVGEFGWGGMAGTWVLMDPAEQLTVVYMEQMVPDFEMYVQPRLRAIIYGCL